MTNIEIKIIRFLLTAAIYSEEAICKNLGISLEELKKAFFSLKQNGYLEPYETFLIREQLNENNHCSSHSSCSSCSSGCSGCSSKQETEDYSNIFILTEKALEEFNYEE